MLKKLKKLSPNLENFQNFLKNSPDKDYLFRTLLLALAQPLTTYFGANGYTSLNRLIKGIINTNFLKNKLKNTKKLVRKS